MVDAFVISVPWPALTFVIVPALEVVFTVTALEYCKGVALPDKVIFPPALAWYTPEFATVTLPVDGLLVALPVAVIATPFNTESTEESNPNISTCTLSFIDDAATPVPVNFHWAVSVVNVFPLFCDIISVGVGPGSAHVLSPLK